MQIEVCLVAARRPDLLRRTLDSFNLKMFSNFEVTRVLANVDPIFGDEAAHRECVDLIKQRSPNVTIFEPEEANFCRAVKRVWTGSAADVIFHLEDDWVLNQEIHPSDVLPVLANPRTKQVALNTAEKHWDINRKGKYAYFRKRVPLFWGIELRPKFPAFSTSPSFLSGDFARRAAKLMDPTFDPEKQFYHSLNPSLEKFVKPFQAEVVGGLPVYPITDIGREWRGDRSISKRIVDGNSVWTVEK